MKTRIIESILFEKFDPSFTLEYDAEELISDTYDEGKDVYGTIYIDVEDVLDPLWDYINDDKARNEIIDEEKLNIFKEDQKAWESWVEENYETLINRYEHLFKNYYYDEAQEKLYDDWDNHCNEPPHDQTEEDMREYNDLVASNLGLK